jgi:uncharacterized protein YhaN
VGGTKMKILKAEITGFGRYHNQVIEFVHGNQLLFGENEIGKSTLYQFMAAMLFGFPKRTAKKKDYTPKNGAAYGGRLWVVIEPYGEVVIERYRQTDRGRAKVYFNGQTGDEEMLAQMIQPLNQALFFDVFTFQQEQLTQIDKLQENELHQALISLGISGSQRMLQQVARYETINQQQYKPRGQKLPLNKALKQLEKLQETIAQKESEETRLQQQYQQIAHLQSELDQLEEKQQQQSLRYQTIQQQISHWSLYEEWQQLNNQAPIVAEQEAHAISRFYQHYQHLTEEIRQKEAELDHLEQGQESDKYFFYLDHEHAITQILQQQVEMARLMDRQQQAKESQQQAQFALNQLIMKRQWSKESPPFQTEQIQEQLLRLEQSDYQLEESEKRLAWLQEKEGTLQQELSRLEQSHPNLMGDTPKPNFLSGLVGVLAFVAAFFLETPWRWLGIAIGVASVGWFIWSMMKQRPDTQEADKRQWQELLVQIDLLAAEIADLAESTDGQSQQNERWKHALHPFFGDEPYHNWSVFLLDYQEDVANYQAYVRQLREAHAQLEEIEEQLQPYQQLFVPFADWLPLQNKTVLEQANLLHQFNEEMQEIKLSRLQQPSTLLAQQLARKKAERTALLEESQEILTKAGIERPAEINLWLKQWETQQRGIKRAAELASMLQPIFPEATTQEALVAEKNQVTQQQKEIQQLSRQKTEQRQRLEIEVAASQKSGTLSQLYQAESELRAKIEQLAIDWSSRQLAASVLTDLTTELSEQQLPQLLEQASTYFRLLSNDRYTQVRLQDGQLVASNASDSYSIVDLSTGTKDQLIMAIRFGYLALQRAQPISPIIIDDGWLHYDSTRKERLAELFAEFGRYYQVICLSSDQEMVSYYHKYQQSVQELSQRM